MVFKICLFITLFVVGLFAVLSSSDTSISRGTSTLTRFVTSTEDSVTSAIEGFGTDLQCIVNSCKNNGQKVKWYKNDELVSEEDVVRRERLHIKHNILYDTSRDCSEPCSSNSTCTEDEHCLDQMCCPCASEEFTLAITNLTINDAGVYKCSLEPGGNSIDIRLSVLESGAFPVFSQSLSFDHSNCCLAQGMSPECLPLCKPSTLENHKFDPIPCQKQFNKLLYCATEGGNISHVHCCRLNFIPPFCWQYCTGAVRDSQRSNRLCLYWMPEILLCYDRAYAPYPGPPEQVLITNLTSTSIELCWDKPKIRGDTVQYYTVRYQEVPRFPFLGASSMPFLIDSSDGPQDDDVLEKPVDEDIPPSSVPSSSSLVSHPLSHSFGTLTARRRKRQSSLVISTHNFATNETEIREFKYSEVNTTDLCATADKLKPSTQYSLYVVSTNDYGSSLASLRLNAVTSTAILPNISLPDIKQCCAKNNVEQSCQEKLCDVRKPPTSASVLGLALSCRKEFSLVTPCLADGRDHTQCCKDKGVGGECLKLCNGAASNINMASVLCLSLDIQSIYLCYREGYISLPSQPVNVTVTEISPSTATVTWSEPQANHNKVTSYSLFYKQNSAKVYKEVPNATSPYTILSLSPDVTYDAYVVARGAQGSSLRSPVVNFITKEPEFDHICEYGKILRDAYDEPFICGGSSTTCPPLFRCTDGGTDDPMLKFCCPTDRFVDSTPETLQPPDIGACCAEKGVSSECLSLCSYNVTIDEILGSGSTCINQIESYVECGGAGRNNTACCKAAGVSAEPLCMDFCAPPLSQSPHSYSSCASYTDQIVKCNFEGVLSLPGPALNLRLEDSGFGWATVGWDKPLHLSSIKRYELTLYDLATKINNTYNTSGLSMTIENLKPEVKYVARIVTWNNKGSSLPSEPLSFALKHNEPTSDEDYKPQPPTNVNKVWYRQGKANISWTWSKKTVTNKPIDRFRFRVHYKAYVADKPSKANWSTLNTTNFHAILENLIPMTSYNIKLVAINFYRNVESVFSETLNIHTNEVRELPHLETRTEPESVIEGNALTIFCKGSGDPVPHLTLGIGARVLAKGLGTLTHVIENIKRDYSNQLITCTADNGGHMIRQKINLLIKYKPIVKIESKTTSSSFQDMSTRFYCSAHSYPRPKVTWLFANSASEQTRLSGIAKPPELVKENSNKIIKFHVTGQENVYNVSLNINNLGLSDSGTYYCKACAAEVGCSNDSVKLLVEPFPIPRGPDYLLTCCKEHNVAEECLSACTTEPDSKALSRRCLSDLPKLFACARDGNDYRRCCIKAGVPDSCLSYCNIGVPYMDISPASDDCVDYRSNIVTCVQDNHMQVAGPPTDLRIKVLGAKKVNVSWKAPIFNDKSVELYVLYYKSLQDVNYSYVRTPETFHILDNLEPNRIYNFTAISVNSFGFSSFSKMSTRRLGYEDFLTSEYSSTSTAGSVLGVIVCLLVPVLLVLLFIYYNRNPHQLPAFILKMRALRHLRRRRSNNANGHATVGAVAFENPGYDSDGKVIGLPEQSNDSHQGSSSSSSVQVRSRLGGHWENAQLETPDDLSPAAEQRGMRYTQLT